MKSFKTKRKIVKLKRKSVAILWLIVEKVLTFLIKKAILSLLAYCGVI